MDIVLVVLAFVFLLAGLLGSVVPVIPGPPLGFIGLILMKLSGRADFSITFLIIWAAIVVAVTIMDYTLPAWLTKKFGGSRAAVWGSVLGLIVGMFFAPLGMMIGPFLGALVGEMLNNSVKAKRGKLIAITDIEDERTAKNVIKESGDPNDRALKAAFGAFLAFIVGTGAKLITGSLMIYYAIKALFQ